MFEEMLLMKELNDGEKLMFQNQYNDVKKSGTTAILLALFLGGFGAHQFYMGNPVQGIF